MTASSVRKAVRLGDEDRAVRARLRMRLRNWKMDKQVL